MEFAGLSRTARPTGVLAEGVRACVRPSSGDHGDLDVVPRPHPYGKASLIIVTKSQRFV